MTKGLIITAEDLDAFKKRFSEELYGTSETHDNDFKILNGMYSPHSPRLENIVAECFETAAIMHYAPIFRKNGWFKQKPELANICVDKLERPHDLMRFTLELLEDPSIIIENPFIASAILKRCGDDAFEDYGSSSAIHSTASLLESVDGLVELSPHIATLMLDAYKYDQGLSLNLIDRIEAAPGLLESSKELTVKVAKVAVNETRSSVEHRSIDMVERANLVEAALGINTCITGKDPWCGINPRPPLVSGQTFTSSASSEHNLWDGVQVAQLN